jgi:hypothetical protein
MRPALLLAIASLALAAPADGVVLCAKQRTDGTFSASVKLREVCRPNETALAAPALNPSIPFELAVPIPSTTSTSTSSTTTTTITPPSCAEQGSFGCQQADSCVLGGMCASTDLGLVCIDSVASGDSCEESAECPLNYACWSGSCWELCR